MNLRGSDKLLCDDIPNLSSHQLSNSATKFSILYVSDSYRHQFSDRNYRWLIGFNDN